MSTQDRRLDKIAEVFNPRPDPVSGDIFTLEDIARAIETLEADPNPACILGYRTLRWPLWSIPKSNG